MLTYVQIQIKGSSRDIEQLVNPLVQVCLSMCDLLVDTRH